MASILNPSAIFGISAHTIGIILLVLAVYLIPFSAIWQSHPDLRIWNNKKDYTKYFRDKDLIPFKDIKRVLPVTDNYFKSKYGQKNKEIRTLDSSRFLAGKTIGTYMPEEIYATTSSFTKTDKTDVIDELPFKFRDLEMKQNKDTALSLQQADEQLEYTYDVYD